MLVRAISVAFAMVFPVIASAQTLGPGDKPDNGGGMTTRAANILLYVGAGTYQDDGVIATSVHCANRTNATVDIRLLFRDDAGNTIWNVTSTILRKSTKTFSTSGTFYGETVGPGGSDLQQGSVMIFGSNINTVCAAELVDTSNNPTRSPMPQTTKLRMMRLNTPAGASQ
jgi:hypothetical protein